MKKSNLIKYLKDRGVREIKFPRPDQFLFKINDQWIEGDILKEYVSDSITNFRPFLKLCLKMIGKKVTLILNNDTKNFHNDDALCMLDKLKPFLNPVFSEFIEKVFLNNKNNLCNFELNYIDYILKPAFSINYITTYTGENKSSFHIMASGNGIKIDDSFCSMTEFHNSKANQITYTYCSLSFFEQYYKSIFQNDDIKESIDFSDCENIFDVFNEVDRLKNIEKMINI